MLRDENFLKIAFEISKASKCVSTQVGAVIVKDGRILSTGYNGTPMGYPNCSDIWSGIDNKNHHEWSNSYEIHAEMNAIIWAARKGISIEDSTVYSTHEPCEQCTKNIIASGIKRIVYSIPYKHVDTEKTAKFLKICNVQKDFKPL